MTCWLLPFATGSRRLLPNLPSHQGKTPQRSESVGDLALCFDRLHRLWHSS